MLTGRNSPLAGDHSQPLVNECRTREEEARMIQLLMDVECTSLKLRKKLDLIQAFRARDTS